MSDRNGDEGGQGGKYARMMAEYSTILLVLPAATFAGYWLGAGLDAWWGTKPLMAAIGILAGAMVVATAAARAAAASGLLSLRNRDLNAGALLVRDIY